MSTDKPKVLRKLKIDEFSLVDVPASTGSDVLIWKRDGGGGEMSPEEVAKRLTDKANAAVDEAMALLEKGGRENAEKAGEFLRDATAYECYRHRIAGVPFAVPVVKVEPVPDHRSEILRLIGEGPASNAKLGELLRKRAAFGQYQELTRSGEIGRLVAARG